MAKHIFVIGGVLSSLGKGIASASIGFLLNRMGYKIGMQKLDPYLNVDPGTMSPYQHGEVYVTEDGGEADLDLGHYERYIGQSTSKASNATSGVIYEKVIQKERRGEYDGNTVQVIPHVTDEIKLMFRKISENKDIVFTEIGGTVGDIEILPFLEAIRQYRFEIGLQNSLVIFLTYVPYMKAAGESKSKPAQHSIIKLREIGIQPDIILCRTEKDFDEDITSKIALYSNVPYTHVKAAVDTDCVYEIPKNFYNAGIHELICNHFNLEIKPVDFSVWDEFIYNKDNPECEANLIMCGKYVEHQDAYISVDEAIKHAAALNKIKINIISVDSEKYFTTKEYDELFKNANGVLVPGGFGPRGIDGKIDIINYARVNNIPFLGICLGMQLAVIEFARNVCGLDDAFSTEFQENCLDPIINLSHKIKVDGTYAGIMRLGAYPCHLKEGSMAKKLYSSDTAQERHRHRYELNNKYRDLLEENGMYITGTSPDGLLTEIIEIPKNHFFIGVQFHPEFQSRPDKPHDLFVGFIKAIKERVQS